MLALRLLSESELHYAFSRPLHAAYIDVKAAFDSVDRAALWKALKVAGIPPFLMHLLCDLHTGTTAKVRMPNGFPCHFTPLHVCDRAAYWPQPLFLLRY